MREKLAPLVSYRRRMQFLGLISCNLLELDGIQSPNTNLAANYLVNQLWHFGLRKLISLPAPW